MGTLASALQTQRKASLRGPSCAIDTLTATLTPADAASLETAFADLAMPASAIARALREEGHNISANTAARHRRGECACESRR